MKFPVFVTAALCMTPAVGAQAAPRVATTLPAAELSRLEEIRRNVWVNWFSGDTASLRRVLGPELVAMGPTEPHWRSLSETLAGSAAFKAGGGKFVSVTFDSNTVHRFGDVVVIFSRYALVTEASGKRNATAGRVTEVFVRNQGRWVHTSWHLDGGA